MMFALLMAMTGCVGMQEGGISAYYENDGFNRMDDGGYDGFEFGGMDDGGFGGMYDNGFGGIWGDE